MSRICPAPPTDSRTVHRCRSVPGNSREQRLFAVHVLAVAADLPHVLADQVEVQSSSSFAGFKEPSRTALPRLRALPREGGRTAATDSKDLSRRPSFASS